MNKINCSYSKIFGLPNEIFNYCASKICPICNSPLKIEDDNYFTKLINENGIFFNSSLSCSKDPSEYYVHIEWTDINNIYETYKSISFIFNNKLYCINKDPDYFDDKIQVSCTVTISDASNDFLLNTSEKEYLINPDHLNLDKFTIKSLVKNINTILLLK